MDYIQLDAGSTWSTSNLIRHYVREGNLVQAREQAPKLKDAQGFGLTAACLFSPTSAETLTLAREAAAKQLADRDPEPRYVVAGDFLVCRTERRGHPADQERHYQPLLCLRRPAE